MFATLALVLLIAIYNDFTIKWRVERSFGAALPPRSGLALQDCHRLTRSTMWACSVTGRSANRRGAPTALSYDLVVQGRCWYVFAIRTPPGSSGAGGMPGISKLRGCLSLLYPPGGP